MSFRGRRRGRRRRRERMREQASVAARNLAALRTELVTRRERERERERDLLSQKGKPREALEFTRFDACLRVSPAFRQRALEDISAWVVGMGLPDSGQVGWPATVDRRRRRRRRAARVSFEGTGRSRSIVTVRGHDIRHFSVVSIEALTRESCWIPRHMYRGHRAFCSSRDPRRRKTVLPRHEDGKRERKTIAIYARM